MVLLTQTNQGPGAARQTGLKHATGKYIAWCDSDDWYESDCLETLYKYLVSYDADISVCRAQIPGSKVECDSDIVQCWDHDEAIDIFLEHKLLNGVLWNKLIKRELFENVDFDKSLWYWEDLQVVWSILKKAKRVVKVNQAKYNFYVHSESICAGKYNEKRFYASKNVWNGIVEDCTKMELKAHLEKAEIRRFVWMYGELRLMLRDGYKNKKDIKATQEILKKDRKKGIKNLNRVHQMYAFLVMYQVPIASIPYKMRKLYH